MQGKFIVFEGIDGSGTTTQSKKLAQAIGGAWTCEPTPDRYGALARQIIRGEVSVSDRPDCEDLTKDEFLVELFAKDRHEHIFGKGRIGDHLRDGKTVICDRYTPSSFAYAPQELHRWVHQLNKDFLRPDLVFYLDVPVEVALARIAKRGEADPFEKEDKLTAAKAEYERLFKSSERYPYLGKKIVWIEGDRPVEEIHADILAEIRNRWN